MKNNTKALMAVLAVALMMGCALVPIVAENTKGDSTDCTDASNIDVEMKGDVIPKLLSGTLSGVTTKYGITLVKDVQTTPMTDFPHTIATKADGKISNGQSVTLSGDYTINNDGASTSGVITVQDRGMLVLFPLDGENTGFSITQPDNASGGREPAIVMEYGSYLNIFGITFQFLSPQEEDVELLTVTEKDDFTCLPGTPTIKFEFNQNGEFKLIPHFLNSRSGNATCVSVLDGWMNMDREYGDAKDEYNKYTGINYRKWYLEGGTIEKIDGGVIIKNTKLNIGTNNYTGENSTSTLICGQINELSIVCTKSSTETPVTGKRVVTTEGNFSLNASLMMCRYNFSYDSHYELTASMRTDYSTTPSIDTGGIVEFKKKTTSTHTDDVKKLEVNNLHLETKNTLVIRSEFPSLSYAYRCDSTELPTGYDNIKKRYSIGFTGDSTNPYLSDVTIRIDGFVFDATYSLDSNFKVTAMSITTGDIIMSMICESGIKMNIDVGQDAAWDENKNESQEDWYWYSSNNLAASMTITGFSISGDMDNMTLKFSLNGIIKTVLDGTEYATTFAINGFNGVLKEVKEIIIDSISLTNELPISKMMIGGYEWNITKRTKSDVKTDVGSEQFGLDDHFVNVSTGKITIKGSAINVKDLKIDQTNVVRDDVLYGDVSITFKDINITKDGDDRMIQFTDVATGTVQNPGSDKQLFSVDKGSKVKMIGIDEYELVSGTARFGSCSLPISITVDSGAALEVDGTKFQEAIFAVGSKSSGKLVLGDEIEVIEGKQKKLVIRNINPDACDITFDLTDLTKATVVAHDGYYLPAQYSGTGYAITSSDGRNGNLVISGTEADIYIECGRDHYNFKFKGSTETEIHMAGEAIELPDGPVKEGYEFAGWTDGSGKVFNDVYFMPARDVILRPVYAAVDVTPVFKEVDGTNVMYIDGGDAEIVKIPYCSSADWIVVKTKDVTVGMPLKTFNEYYYWANTGSTAEYSDIYLKAIRMDVTEGVFPYNINILNSDGVANDIYVGQCEFRITVKLETDKEIKSVNLFSDDGCGLSHPLEVSEMNRCSSGAYEITFDVNCLSTFTVEPVYKEDSGSTTTYLGVAIAIAVVICLIIGLAFYWKDNKH